MTAAAPARAARISPTGVRQLAGLLFFVLAAGFMTVIMLAASIAPGYDFSGGAISDLGVIRSTALLFNASLIAVGVLNFLGGYLYYRSHRNAWVLALCVAAGIGAVGAGLFPLDRGGLHSIFALVAFLCFNLEAIAVGSIEHGWMKPVSILAGTIGLVFVVLMVIGDGGNSAAFGPIGHGGAERMIVYPAMLWMLGLGGQLMSGQDDSDRVSEARP